MLFVVGHPWNMPESSLPFIVLSKHIPDHHFRHLLWHYSNIASISIQFNGYHDDGHNASQVLKLIHPFYPPPKNYYNSFI